MVDDKNLRKIQRELSRMVSNEDEAWQYVLELVETDWKEVARVDRATRASSCRGCYKSTLCKNMLYLSDVFYYCVACQDAVKKGYKHTCPDCHGNFISHDYSSYYGPNTIEAHRGILSFRCLKCMETQKETLANRMNRQCLGCESIYKTDIYVYPSLCKRCEDVYGVDDRAIRQEYQKVNTHILRAKALDLPATLTMDEWFSLLIDAHWLCQYCLTFPYEHLDHFIPLCKGGGTTKNNVIPACKKCNRLKGQRHPDIVISIPREALDRIRAYLRQF